MKTIELLPLFALLLAGCGSAPPSPGATPSRSAVSATIEPASPAGDRGEAVRTSPGAAAEKPVVVSCTLTRDGATYGVRFDLDSMRGTFTLDGPATRRIAFRAVPHAGTYVLLFTEYGSGDRKEAGETLRPNRSIVTRYVTDGDESELYFDGDLHPGDTTINDPLRCAR